LDSIRDEVKRIIFGEDEFETRFQFFKAFETEVGTFLDRVTIAVNKFEGLSKYAGRDQRRAYSAAFIWNALNDLILSMRLFLSRYQVPAGALMRQFAESIAMSLLMFDPSQVKDLTNLDKYGVHTAMDKVGQKKISAKLGIDRAGWAQFQKASKTYDKLSHASALALGAGSMVFETGAMLIGGVFDREKTDAYRREISLRISAAERVTDTEDHLIWLWENGPAADGTQSYGRPRRRDMDGREEEVREGVSEVTQFPVPASQRPGISASIDL
jgi:hypothetical protein